MRTDPKPMSTNASRALGCSLFVLAGILHFLCMTADGFRGGWYVAVNVLASPVSAFCAVYVSRKVASMQGNTPLPLFATVGLVALPAAAAFLSRNELFFGFGAPAVVIEYLAFSLAWFFCLLLVLIGMYLAIQVKTAAHPKWHAALPSVVGAFALLTSIAPGAITGIGYWFR